MNKSFFKVIIWALLILAGSLISGNSLNEIKFINIPYFDKIVHFTWYFVLCLLLLSAIYKKLIELKVKNYFLIVFLCTVYGVLMELLQGSLSINRSEDFYDALTNSIGALFGAILYVRISKIKFIKKLL